MNRGARRALKWLAILLLVSVIGLALWFAAFPYLTTLLPESF